MSLSSQNTENLIKNLCFWVWYKSREVRKVSESLGNSDKNLWGPMKSNDIRKISCSPLVYGYIFIVAAMAIRNGTMRERTNIVSIQTITYIVQIDRQMKTEHQLSNRFYVCDIVCEWTNKWLNNIGTASPLENCKMFTVRERFFSAIITSNCKQLYIHSNYTKHMPMRNCRQQHIIPNIMWSVCLFDAVVRCMCPRITQTLDLFLLSFCHAIFEIPQRQTCSIYSRSNPINEHFSSMNKKRVLHWYISISPHGWSIHSATHN